MIFEQAGEDLEEEDDEKEEDVEQDIIEPPFTISPVLVDIPEETTSLLRSPSRSRSRRRRTGSVGPHGNATVTQAVLMVCII